MKVMWRKSIILVSIIILLLGGCSQGMNVSAEEIIHNAIESEKDVTTYHGVSEMKMFDGEEMTEHIILEENVADEKRKVLTKDQLLDQEVEVFNDGQKMIMYDKGKGQAHEMDTSELGDIAGSSPKDQLKTMMESMKDSHTYEMSGEEKVLDYDTYHIEIKANEADNLLGDMELWVDQKTWFVVKMISETGDVRTELEYTELDFSPEFPEGTFTLEIPDDVEIENLEESFGPDTVTLEEAEEALGQAFLVLPEEEVHLSNVQMYDFSSELERYEVELTYSSEEDIPMFTLSIFPTPEEMAIEGADLEIRGNPAEYEEVINGYLWDEDGLRYSLLMTNPDVEEEEILNMLENMKLSSDE
ncbi:LolA family protein [Oceanobacillus halophilus]|uniref:Outer membrane lipoprotein carrier protein LolA n=1 Tax=Oceanobacillus halophilus TaxID=930130 RepID=A0A495A4M3_9BACI|nr:hypothetical protein [Oceanobacillus halophilus]RKQ34000.1 hypothetical protein D8M06_09275 [Oceanobacillus halophilus]